MSQILDMVEIETGDTDSAPWNHGSLASSTMFRSGWATRAAAKDARRQLIGACGVHGFGRVVQREGNRPSPGAAARSR
mgnify:CR=1 FL=1